jgi:hypothetical protein
MHDSDRIAAGCEWALRRTVDGEPPLNVRFQIGHQGRSLDLDDDGAGPMLRDRRVFEPERSAEAVESSRFHGQPLHKRIHPDPAWRRLSCLRREGCIAPFSQSKMTRAERLRQEFAERKRRADPFRPGDMDRR